MVSALNDMSIAIEPKKTEGAQRYIQVTIPVTMVNEAKQAAARKLASRVAIPGFRPGKAPAAMVMKRYADSIKAEALDHLVQDAYREVLDREHIKAASQPHHFLSVTKGGHSAIVSTTGNEDCHIILRGGKAPNYDRASVESACREAGNAALACRLMIDCSHGNSQKNPDNQLLVTQDIVDQMSEGESRIFGVMLESNLVAGREDLVIGKPLTYGRSITDACLSWEATEQALEMLAEGVAERRVAMAN